MDTDIHFALLLPMNRSGHATGDVKFGPHIVGAAELAVERINDSKTLLPGRVLRYSWRNSGCSQKQGLSAMGDLLGEVGARVDAVIGPACSSACEVTNYLSIGQHVPQISYRFAKNNCYQYTVLLYRYLKMNVMHLAVAHHQP